MEIFRFPATISSYVLKLKSHLLKLDSRFDKTKGEKVMAGYANFPEKHLYLFSPWVQSR